MSNYLAIATVTETLRYIIQQEVTEKIDGTSVTIRRPSAKDNEIRDPGINIFMYHAGVNKFLRNDDLPMRKGDGSFINAPTVALNLDYLFSFYGDEDKHEPQRLMGLTLSRMHAYPVLEIDMINGMIASKKSDNYLKNSDLSESLENIKFSLLPFSLEEMYKLCSALQAPYTLSAAFQASVVLLESEIITSASALPVGG